MKRHLVTAGALMGLSLAGSANAMPHCGDRMDVIAALSDQYSESHVASGLQSSTGLMEIWVSSEASTWTILLTRPDGQTCVLASGTHWLETLADVVPAGDPA